MKKYFLLVLLTFIAGCSSQNGVANNQLEELRGVANNGDVRAQSQMGDAHLFGEFDLPVDYKEAFIWYSRAATQGDAKSQYNLAIMYLNGYGIEKDLVKAVKSYRKAAEQGDSDSQLQLGIRYLQGEGVKTDLKIAEFWFRKATENGNTEAIEYIKEIKNR
ncbi:tetratricopeptide repeat protein [Acinetobacter rudis]|uniref:tetratricopeptide repeat protein n=1 Tax=Acinetobacter rudis TaxID=632955 RepID=UPI0033404FD3